MGAAGLWGYLVKPGGHPALRPRPGLWGGVMARPTLEQYRDYAALLWESCGGGVWNRALTPEEHRLMYQCAIGEGRDA